MTIRTPLDTPYLSCLTIATMILASEKSGLGAVEPDSCPETSQLITSSALDSSTHASRPRMKDVWKESKRSAWMIQTAKMLLRMYSTCVCQAVLKITSRSALPLRSNSYRGNGGRGTYWTAYFVHRRGVGGRATSGPDSRKSKACSI